MRDLFTNTHTRKFNDIRMMTNQNLDENMVVDIFNSSCPQNWFKNLSSNEIPNEIIQIVSLGQKFNLNKNLDEKSIINIIKNVEHLIERDGYSDQDGHFSNTDIEDIRNIIIRNILNNMNKTRHISYIEKVFEHQVNMCRKFLKNNPNIFFTMADKGNVTVALDREEYVRNVNVLLSDTTTYLVLKRNPLTRLQETIRDLLHRWNNRKYFHRTYNKFFLSQSDTSLPRFYGLPKIHKTGNPLRPIVSAINSPTYFISKVISESRITSLDKPSSYVHNSHELITKLRDVFIPDDHILVSLDVSSLFTNISLELVIQGIEKRYNQIRCHTSAPLNEFLTTATIIMNNTYFQFGGKFYHQIFGSPMGSPTSPQFADIVMVDLEKHCLNQLDFTPLFFYRYG